MFLNDGSGRAIDKRTVPQIPLDRSQLIFDPGDFFIQPILFPCPVCRRSEQENLTERRNSDWKTRLRLIPRI
jgi:hypothetical protein